MPETTPTDDTHASPQGILDELQANVDRALAQAKSGRRWTVAASIGWLVWVAIDVAMKVLGP